MTKIKKISIIILLLAILNVSLSHSARADTWGANMMAAIWKETTEEMVLKIKETIIANLKMAAIRIVQGRIMTLLTGSPGSYGMGGGSLVITDWRDYIYGSSQRYSTQVTNDFFTNLRSGSPSMITQRVIDPAERAVNTDWWNMRPDLQNYIASGDASKIFQSGQTSNKWYVFRKALEPQNDLIVTTLRGEGVLAESFRQEEEKQKAQGIAGQGYKSVESSSQEALHAGAAGSSGSLFAGAKASSTQSIKTPGSSVKSLVDEIMSMPVKMLTLARSIPEIATSMITQVITQMIQQGLAQVTAPIDQRIMQMRNQAFGSLTSSTSNIPYAGQLMNSSIGQMQGMIQSGVGTSNIFFSR